MLLKAIFLSKAFNPLIRLIRLIRLLIRRFIVFEETEAFYGANLPFFVIDIIIYQMMYIMILSVLPLFVSLLCLMNT